MINFFAISFVGLFIGFISGYAGIGGAPFMIALLTFLFSVPQLKAQGIVLTMMLGPMSLLALLTLKKEVKEQWKSILIGVLTYAFFSYFGAYYAFLLGSFRIQRFFAYFLIMIALFDFFFPFFHKKKKEILENKTIPHFWMFFISLFIAFIGGFFGIGAGILMIPIFMNFFHLSKNRARALSLAILLPPVSIGAFLVYYQKREVHLLWSILLFFSYFFANYFGAKFGNHSKKETFRFFYDFILFVMGILILLS